MDRRTVIKLRLPPPDDAPNCSRLQRVLRKHRSYSINTTHAVEKSTEPSEVLK